MLVKEINHRVKNSLQLVASMLNLRASAHDDPTIRQVLGDASARVGAISRAHDRLYRSTDIGSIELAAYLADVCRDLTELMPNCSVDFEAACRAHMATDRAIRLALLVTELVTNAAKHAYASGGGRISVKLALGDPQTATVSVIDEGVGLPEGFRADQVRGLGMRLIQALVEQMDASLRFDRRAAKGASFTVDVALR